MKTSDQYAKFLEMKKRWGQMDAFEEKHIEVLHAANETGDSLFFLTIPSLAVLGFLSIILSASSMLQGLYVLLTALVFISFIALMKQFNLKEYFAVSSATILNSKAESYSIVSVAIAKKMVTKMKFFANLTHILTWGFFGFSIWIDLCWLFENASISNLKQLLISTLLVMLLFPLIYFGKWAQNEFRNLNTKINQLIEIFEDKPSYDCWQEK